jgi:hypothetical protein
MTVEWGDISLGGTQGYQSVSDVYLLFDKHTDCNVTLNIAVDGTYVENLSMNTASISRGQIDKHLTASSMKNQSVRVKVTTVAPGANTGTGQSVSIVGLTYKAGILEGPYKAISATNKG